MPKNEADFKWTCKRCTYGNWPSADKCVMCKFDPKRGMKSNLNEQDYPDSISDKINIIDTDNPCSGEDIINLNEKNGACSNINKNF